MKTRSVRKEDMENGTYPRQWWIVDGEGMALGRLATQIADYLRGKHKPIYTPHVDTGDFVVVVNAEKIALTGNKMQDKIYYHHTGYPGGMKSARAGELLAKKPTELVYKAVKGMMPKNALNRSSIHKLKVYAGSEHPHAAQKPQPFPLKG
ncbi:MAG: 50S ribosomal protein L13 [SAR324 cluster bacterium]|nr:50S ribosomal protein L13 [SAR324 cluster bacterium]